jgi:geranylgeranyl diphosphate synthase, type II
MSLSTESLISSFNLIEPAIEKLGLPIEPAGLYDPITYTMMVSGKRLRPKLVMLGSALCGGDPAKALSAGLAMELLHNFTLIHDDIMDNADTRRGKPTVYRKWGVPLAILSGDMTFGLAYEQLHRYGQDPDIDKNRFSTILSLFHNAVREVCEGQAYDIQFEQVIDVSMDAYLEMIRQKTAALLSASLAIGGTVSGGTSDQIGHLEQLGTEAGIAFQIQDDLLDVVADPSKFGKKVGGDIREGKKTWLMIKALERANTNDRELLVSVIQSKSASDTQISDIIRLYEQLGVIDDATSEIYIRYSNAMNHLGVFADTPYYSEAKQLFDSLIQRDN